MKKAAMFGLDARIALAIFGALSVISGAALYSAIQEAKIVAMEAEVSEVTKALEAFIIDTGIYPASRTDGEAIHANYLVENPANVAGWNGPYLSYTKEGTTGLDHKEHGTIYLTRVKDDTWTAYNPTGVACPKAHTGSCSVFLKYQDFKDDAMLKTLETRIDGTTNPGADNYAGSFRYNSATNAAWFKTIVYDKSQGAD
tara:strand:+ start:1926 stop:2522 length:597 start_codon:yes stop_codon:yes gene_type:complete